MRGPTAFSMLREGLAVFLDAVGVVLLAWLAFQVMFGLSQPFLTSALWVGAIGVLASLITPRAARNVPLPMLAYVGVALLSAAVHQWPRVVSASERDWLALFTPASHLLVMVVVVAGAGHWLRTGRRLTGFALLLVGAFVILAAQILFDRATSAFLFPHGRSGNADFPSVGQWGGLHQTGMLLVLALPFPLAIALLGRTPARLAAGTLLGGALLAVAVANGSTGAIVAMLLTIGAMVAALLVANVRFRKSPTSMLLAAFGISVALGLTFAVATGRISFVATGDLAGRIPIWRAAAAMCRDHPLLGVGPQRYSESLSTGGYAARYHVLPGGGGFSQAHNLALQTGAETGVTGMLLMLTTWIWMFRACWRAWLKKVLPVLAYGLMFALVGFLIRSMSDNFLDGLATTDRTRVLVWLLFGAVLGLDRFARPGGRLDGDG